MLCDIAVLCCCGPYSNQDNNQSHVLLFIGIAVLQLLLGELGRGRVVLWAVVVKKSGT